MGKLIPGALSKTIGQRYLHRKGKVLYISQPLFKDEKEVDTLDYFCQMLASLVIHIADVDHYDMVVKIPKSIDGWSQQINFLTECEKIASEYDFVIISPYDRKRISEHIINLQQANKNLKIFTIDKGYTDSDFPEFELGKVDPPKYIQANWTHGGTLAAEALHQYIVHSQPENQCNCQILVVHGNDCHEREDAFVKKIEDFSSADSPFNAQTNKICGNFLRDQAYLETLKWIDGNIINIANKPLYGIFSCNDEMALGVRQAIMELEKSIFKDYTPQIIGFDGIKDVTLRIQDNDKYLYGTINIKVDKQVKELVEIIRKTYKGIKVDQPKDLECELLKRPSA